MMHDIASEILISDPGPGLAGSDPADRIGAAGSGELV